MNEELKIIISAEVGKLKQGVQQAKTAIGDIDKQANKSSSQVEKAMDKMAKAAKKAGEKIAHATKRMFQAAALGVATIGTAAVKEYANYEQLVGGVETLFKSSSDTVQKYAMQAYKTAGLSANQYMETVTGFSASLLQSLGGDTAKAAEYANQAVIDMSDNANKMGTSMESIQNAYQGFAKQNYTMLDNLKLGYGGTKSEMERLIADANRVKEANGEMANLSIDSFADVVEAIHTIQTEMGITGTTALEASTTISGSIGMAKAAWHNMLIGIADDNVNFDELMNTFVESVGVAFENLLPRIGTALGGLATLIGELAPIILEHLPTLIETIIPAFVNSVIQIAAAVIEAIPIAITSIATALIGQADVILQTVNQIFTSVINNFPQMITAVVNLILDIAKSIRSNAPQILQNVILLIQTVIQTLLQNLPVLLEAALELFLAIVEALPQIIPQLIAAVPQIVDTVVAVLIQSIPILIDGAITLFLAIIDALPIIIPQLADAMPQIVDAAVDGLIQLIPVLIDGAIQLFMGIVDAIPKIIPKLMAAMDTLVSKLLGKMNFKWSLPHLALPHISITGSFSLKPPRVPHFGISWYEKGGVFDTPTLFGYGNGMLGGLGENGAEAVVPLEKNTQWLDKIAERLNRNSDIPIVLQVDGKVFAETSIKSINDLTKQTGKLGLNIY